MALYYQRLLERINSFKGDAANVKSSHFWAASLQILMKLGVLAQSYEQPMEHILFWGGALNLTGHIDFNIGHRYMVLVLL